MDLSGNFGQRARIATGYSLVVVDLGLPDRPLVVESFLLALSRPSQTLLQSVYLPMAPIRISPLLAIRDPPY